MQARQRAEQFKKEIAANLAQMAPVGAKLGLAPPGPPPSAGLGTGSVLQTIQSQLQMQVGEGRGLLLIL